MAAETPSLPRIDSYFDDRSAFWDELYDRDDVFACIHRRRQATALGFLRRRAEQRTRATLEVGCGAGRLTADLTAFGRVVAIDVSPEMLQRARHHVPARDVVFLCADAAHVPMTSSSVDQVVGLGVLPWVADRSAVLAEVARVLAPGGRAVLNVDNRWRLAGLLDPLISPLAAPLRRFLRRWVTPPESAGPRVTMVTAARFRDELRRAGLRVVAERWLGFGPVTVVGRPVTSPGWAARLDTVLQRRADRGGRIRFLASQYVVACEPSAGGGGR